MCVDQAPASCERAEPSTAGSRPGRESEAPGNPRGTGSSAAPWDLIVKAVGAIAAGIGVLGFVTFAGGVILFERLSGAGIPAEPAVAVVPRAELLTIGASNLLPLACIVGLIVVLIWLVVEVVKDENNPRWLQRNGVALIAGLAAVGGVLYFGVTADHFPRLANIVLLLIVVAGGAVLGVLVWLKMGRLVSDRRMSSAARFGWFAMLVALLVPLEGAMIGWVQSRESPLVRPAVLYDSATRSVIEGFYIAATGGQVYIAEVHASKDPDLSLRATGRMLEFPRSEVTRISIGAIQPLGQARHRWPVLVKEVEATLAPKTVFRVVP